MNHPWALGRLPSLGRCVGNEMKRKCLARPTAPRRAMVRRMRSPFLRPGYPKVVSPVIDNVLCLFVCCFLDQVGFFRFFIQFQNSWLVDVYVQHALACVFPDAVSEEGFPFSNWKLSFSSLVRRARPTVRLNFDL